MAWFNLTLLAIPFGLGYAIVRHRVVDIGFVLNRALVFGAISGIVVIAFGILEWALSNVFVRVSHITSTSLELRARAGAGVLAAHDPREVDHAVDDIFFRDRHAAERALRTFAREVAFVTDPHVAVERAHAELVTRTGAAAAAVYVADAHGAVRVDPAESAAPDTVAIDDPALVRLRATRTPLALRELQSALAGEWAFPMCVRDTVTGVVTLGAKTNGEAYAPDEIATIETVALALGNALDALQTAALRAEVARVLLDGAPLERCAARSMRRRGRAASCRNRRGRFPVLENDVHRGATSPKTRPSSRRSRRMPAQSGCSHASISAAARTVRSARPRRSNRSAKVTASR